MLAREYLSLHHCERMDTLLPASGRKMKLAGCSISTRYGKCKQHDDLVLMLLTKFFEVSGPIAGTIGCLMAGKVNQHIETSVRDSLSQWAGFK